MTLDEAHRQTNLSRNSIVYQCSELVLDCRPMEPSYAWLGLGIVDRKLHQMPDLGLLIEESRHLVLRRLQYFRYKSFGFNLVEHLRIRKGERILELTRPRHGRVENITARRWLSLLNSICTSRKSLLQDISLKRKARPVWFGFMSLSNWSNLPKA